MSYNISNFNVVEIFENHKDECPICTLQKINEEKTIEKVFDGLVMNVEFNQKLGDEFTFCKSHFEKLYAYHDKLGLALLLNNIITKELPRVENMKGSSYKNSFIDSINKKIINKSTSNQKEEMCYICSHVNSITRLNVENMIKLWAADAAFKALYKSCSGFCGIHYKQLIDISCSILKNNEFEDFKKTTCELQINGMKTTMQNLEAYIKKFDYRYTGTEGISSSDSVKKGIERLIGYFNEEI